MHDGYRLMARKVDGRVRLYTKRGYDWSRRYPLIAEVTSVVFDGVVAKPAMRTLHRALGGDPGTVQRISRPFEGANVLAV